MADQVLTTTTIYPGDVVRLLIAVTDPADGVTAMDPATLVVKVKQPNTAPSMLTYTYGVDAELVRSALGSYYINITANDDGVWYAQVTTTTPDDVDEYWFNVTKSEF